MTPPIIQYKPFTGHVLTKSKADCVNLWTDARRSFEAAVLHGGGIQEGSQQGEVMKAENQTQQLNVLVTGHRAKSEECTVSVKNDFIYSYIVIKQQLIKIKAG